MAACPDTNILQYTFSNGTQVSFCGLPFNDRQTCGFLMRNDDIGVQLCCTLTEAIGSSEAICQFTVGERIGQLMEILASFATGIAVSGLLGYAVYRKLRNRWRRRTRRNFSNQVLHKTDAIDSSLFMNLMVAELIQATGNLLTIKWIAQGHIVNEDAVCTAQGALKQIGIVLVALTSLAISIQAFYALVLRWPIRKPHSRWMIVALWICVALDVMIPNLVFRNAESPYYGSTGYWCWIYPAFKTEQIVTEYLYMWVAAFLMVILYGLMAIFMRGWVVLTENGSLSFGRWRAMPGIDSNHSIPRSEREDTGEDYTDSKAVAKMLLLYPAVYFFSIVPISIARWMQFSGHKIPYQSTLFTATIFALAGFFNVILFFFTRPELVRGGVTESLPALPNASSNLHLDPSPITVSSGGVGASPRSPPIRLRNMSSGTERGDDDADYGLAPL